MRRSGIAETGRRTLRRGAAGLALLVLLPLTVVHAQAPLAGAGSKQARSKVLAAARSYAGTPYRYGGIDRNGLDCSGLVLRAFGDAVGARLPRTTRQLYGFVELIERAKLQPGDLVFFDTEGPLSHVGIYAGEGRFIHAASSGPRPGVIESALAEDYWARRYAGAGRLLSPAGYLGILVTGSAGASLGFSGEQGTEGGLIRGGVGAIRAAYSLSGFELGLEARPSFDLGLGVGRLSLVVSLGLDDKLRFFVGPAMTFGEPRGASGRAYAAGGGWAASAGLSYTPLWLRAGDSKVGLFGELSYDHFVAAEGQSPDMAADVAARVKLGLGLSLRFGI